MTKDLKAKQDDNITRAIGYRNNYETRIALEDLAKLRSDLEVKTSYADELEQMNKTLQEGIKVVRSDLAVAVGALRELKDHALFSNDRKHNLQAQSFIAKTLAKIGDSPFDAVKTELSYWGGD